MSKVEAVYYALNDRYRTICIKSRLFLYKFVMHEMREKNHKEHLKSYQTLDVPPPPSHLNEIYQCTEQEMKGVLPAEDPLPEPADSVKML